MDSLLSPVPCGMPLQPPCWHCRHSHCRTATVPPLPCSGSGTYTHYRPTQYDTCPLLQSLCVWDITEHYLLQTVSVKFPFTQRLPDFGPSPLSLLTLPSPTVTVSCNDYIARFSLRSGIILPHYGWLDHLRPHVCRCTRDKSGCQPLSPSVCCCLLPSIRPAGMVSTVYMDYPHTGHVYMCVGEWV